ncbi:MAG: hypothetical protein GY853_05510 [PVC group bacterium]|nr:hypothetical protein [PVC group bacterium]
MKKDSLLSYLIYIPLSLVLLVTKVFPFEAVCAFGRWLGMIACFFSGKRQRVARSNLKAAFGDRYSHNERKQIVNNIFKRMGQNFCELLFAPRMDERFFNKYTSIKNFDKVKAAAELNKGLIFLSAHYGNWELPAKISAFHGRPMLGLAREQKPYFLNDILNKYRQINGPQITGKGAQLRNIVKHLKDGGIVGMLGDQSGKQGKQMDFFGRPVYMAEGAFRIAAATGSPIVPAFTIADGHTHQLVWEEPIFIAQGEKDERKIELAMLKYRDMLEEYISRDPQQWMWVNKRWKYTRGKSILLLTDGKMGHLRQAQAVANEIMAQRPRSKINTVQIAFKSSWHRNIVTTLTFLFRNFISDPMKLLRYGLTGNCYCDLENTFADVIICCGSLTRAGALLLGRENQAKVIALMNPAPFFASNFDLAIIARHDYPTQMKKVVVIDGALNLISPEYMKEQVDKLKQTCDLSQKLKIGLLIGGDSKDYIITLERIKEIVVQVKKFLKEFDVELLLTTSRRTPAQVQEYLIQSFKDDKQCVLSAFPEQACFDFAMGGILGACSVVIVSGESVSMVSEAATSGAYTIVFPLEARDPRKVKKHEVFLRELKRLKHLCIVKGDSLYEELLQYKRNPAMLHKLDDRKKLKTVIKEKILN